jgi:hypothetical protein
VPGTKAGWVTTLLEHIESDLGRLVPRNDDARIWVDSHALSPIEPLTDQIIAAARNANVLLVILSPAYLDSPWCSRERNEFLQAVEKRGRARVFIVEMQPIEQANKPEQFRELKGFPFWRKKETLPLGFPIPNPMSDRDYYAEVHDLCRWLAEALQQKNTHGPVPGDPTTVFLAPVGYELETQWEGVRRYLDQMGVKTLPESTSSYSLEPESFGLRAKEDLAKCGLFVQLLSEIPFKDSPDSTTDFGQLLVNLARSLDRPIPILQWRHPQTKLGRVADPLHRALLDSETVRAESIEDFKQEVRRRAFEKPREEPPPPGVVLVDATAKDAPLAHQIKRALLDCDAGVVVWEGPGGEGEDPRSDPANMRIGLEDNLKNCDALIVVYGESPTSWVVEQYRQWRKSQARRQRPAHCLALFEGPPQMKPSVSFPSMCELDCRGGFDQAKLRQFLDAIRPEAST